MRIVKLAIIALCILSTGIPTADADEGGGVLPGGGIPVGDAGYVDGGGVFVGYDVKISYNAGRNRPGGSGGPKYECSFFIWESADGTDPATNLQPRHWYILRCHLEGSDELALNTPAIVEYNPNDPDAGRIATQAEVSITALANLTFPAPELTTSPPPDHLVVGFETWFHTETPDNPDGLPEPTIITAAAGPLWATASAEPASIDIDTGDDEPGSIFSCDQIAPPFDLDIDLETQRPDCARYEYQYSSNNKATPGGSYTISAAVTYATYLVTGPNPAPVFQEELVGETTEIIATITQLQAVIK